MFAVHHREIWQLLGHRQPVAFSSPKEACSLARVIPPVRPAPLDFVEAPTEKRRMPDEVRADRFVHESGFVRRDEIAERQRLEDRTRDTLPAPPDDGSS